MAGLWRRGDGMYYAVYRNEAGQVRRRTLETKDEAEARKKLPGVELDIALDKKDPTARWKKVPLLAQLEEYRECLVADGAGEQHARHVYLAAGRVLDSAGIRFTPQLTASKLKVAISKLMVVSQAKNGRGLPPKPASIRTKNFAIQSVKQFLRWMLAEKRIGGFPFEQLAKGNDQHDRRHSRRAFSEDEFLRLVETAANSPRTIEGVSGRDRADIYVIARLTGLRRAEIASLSPSSFHLTLRNPHVIVAADATKNGEQASLPLHRDLLPIIERRIRKLGPLEPLFPGLARLRTAKMVRLDSKAAGIPYKDDRGQIGDFHALRHTYITSLWETGATAAVVQALARHSTVVLTMRYTHVENSAEVAAIKAMPGLSAKNPRRRAK